MRIDICQKKREKEDDRYSTKETKVHKDERIQERLMWADNNTVREKRGKQKKCKDDQEIKTAMSESVAEVDYWLWRATSGVG